MHPLESRQNPKIKEVIKLRQRRARDAAGLFLIEGEREVLRAAEAGVCLVRLFYCRELASSSKVVGLLGGREEYEVGRELFERLSYREGPDGVLAVAKQWETHLSGLSKVEKGVYLLAEGLEKPGNLGAMLRTCDAVGAEALLLCDSSIDLFNPNAVRASMGALFTVPAIQCSLEELLVWLQKEGVMLWAATPDTEHSFWDANVEFPLAVAVGNEHAGLSETVLKVANQKVAIPMMGAADSLNVATSAALLLYEVMRRLH